MSNKSPSPISRVLAITLQHSHMHLRYSVLAGLCIRDMGVDHDENIQFRQEKKISLILPVRSRLSVLKVRLGSSDLELRNTNDIHVNGSDYTRVAANSITQFKAWLHSHRAPGKGRGLGLLPSRFLATQADLHHPGRPGALETRKLFIQLADYTQRARNELQSAANISAFSKRK